MVMAQSLMIKSANGITGKLEDAAVGGLAAGAGMYVYNKVIGSPLTNALGTTFGKYTNVVAAFLVAVGADYAADQTSGMISDALMIAGYGILGRQIAIAAGDAPAGGVAAAQAAAVPQPTASEEMQVASLIREMTYGAPAVGQTAVQGY